METDKVKQFRKPKLGFFCFQEHWKHHPEIGFMWRLQLKDGRIPVLIHGYFKNANNGEKIYIFSPTQTPHIRRKAREKYFLLM